MEEFCHVIFPGEVPPFDMLYRCLPLERYDIRYLIRSDDTVMHIDHEVSTTNEYSFLVIIPHMSSLLNDSLSRHYSSGHEVLRCLLLAREVYVEFRCKESVRCIDRLIEMLDEGEWRSVPYDDIEMYIDRSMF
jgi:hypothetical protein